MISFKARYINSYDIQDTSTGRKDPDYKVSFVETSPFSPKDIESIHDIALDWKDDAMYAGSIYNRFLDCNLAGNSARMRFFALTTQRDSFEKLRPDDVLALGLVSVYDDKIKLNYLQVDPSTNYFSYNRRFKGVGELFLNSLEKLFKGKDITLRSVPSAFDFYKKCGFERIKRSAEFILKSKG